MTHTDKIKLDRLIETYNTNFKVTQLYAAYLENFPEIITKEMIDTLTDDGAIEKKDAIAALLSEIFGLDTDGSAADRRILRDYIIPSLRLLDAKKYEDNPYYRAVRLPDVTARGWQFKNEHYAPYRAVICDDMILGKDFSEVPPLGFFDRRFNFPAVLEDGNEWMTLTPVDLDTCEDAIAASHGKVITFGLGLGYYAFMVARKPEVDSITVVEKSPEVIKLFREYVLPHFENPEKLALIEADAFEYAEKVMPGEGYDYAFVDTWRDASDGTPMYERMIALEHLSPSTTFDYWIEGFLISRRRALYIEEIIRLYEAGKLDTGYDEIEKRLLDLGKRIK